MNKKFLAVPIVLFLIASIVLLVGLSGEARAVPAVKALAAATPTFAYTQLGLGNHSDCFYTGSYDETTNPSGVPLAYTNNVTVKSCVGLNPPPESSCDQKSLTNTMLDVVHEKRDEINIGGFANFYLFYNPGCGAGWSATNVYSGCHVISQISIYDDYLGNTEGGIDANGKLVCAGGWESTKMVDAESASTLTGKVIVDFQPQQTASVTV